MKVMLSIYWFEMEFLAVILLCILYIIQLSLTQIHIYIYIKGI